MKKADAPRVFSPTALNAWLVKQNILLPARTLNETLAEWTHSGAVDRLTGRLYLNSKASPRPTPDEAAPALRPGAVVSLHRVLGHHGVLNNPSHWVTAVVSNDDTTKVGRVETEQQVFRFASLPPALMVRPDQPLACDAIDASHPWMATPEKALLDWLHLASTPRGSASWPLPASHDWDLELLDTARLNRLARGLGLKNLLEGFQKSVENNALDPGPRARSRRLR